MALETDISFCDSTTNLEMGCDGCELWNARDRRECYAGNLTTRYAGRPGWPAAFGQPKLFLERLDAALHWPDLRGKVRSDKPWLDGLPRVIFLCDMGDAFTESLPIDWLAPVWYRIADSCHIWLLLTKRAGRMREFLAQYGCPPNVWPGTSITSMANIGRLDDLFKIDSPHLWVSAEPLRGPLNVLRFDPGVLRWLVAGGESGKAARESDLQWFRDLRDHCCTNGIAFFMKQLGSVYGPHKGIDAIPPDLLIREVPGANPAPQALHRPEAPRKLVSIAGSAAKHNGETEHNRETVSLFPPAAGTFDLVRRMTEQQKIEYAHSLLTQGDRAAIDAAVPIFRAGRTFAAVFEVYEPIILVMKLHFDRPGRPISGQISWGEIVRQHFGVSLRRIQQLLQERREPKRRGGKRQRDFRLLAIAAIKLARAVVAGNGAEARKIADKILELADGLPRMNSVA
jgi:protein gp37